MKKKLIPIVFALVCVLACTLVLTACNDDGKGKPHSAEKWNATLGSAIQSKHFTLSLSSAGADGDYQWFETGYYKENSFLVTQDAAGDVRGLIQDGSKYYGYINGQIGVMYEDKVEEFKNGAAGLTMGAYEEFSAKILEKCKASYADFSYWGDGNYGVTDGSEGSVNVIYNSYRLENTSLEITSPTDGATVTYSVEAILVKLVQDTAELFEIEVVGIGSDSESGKMKIVYKNGTEEIDYMVNSIVLPDVHNKTFALANIEVKSNGINSAAEGIREMASRWVIDNYDKTIKCNADGTLEGDIEIGGELFSSFTLTEGASGEITLTKGDKTLTGYCLYSNGIVELMLDMDMQADEYTTVTLRFTLRYIAD